MDQNVHKTDSIDVEDHVGDRKLTMPSDTDG